MIPLGLPCGHSQSNCWDSLYCQLYPEGDSVPLQSSILKVEFFFSRKESEAR